MSHSVYHVRCRGGRWEVVKRRAGGGRVISVDSKAEAVRRGRDLSRSDNGELVIHDRTGRTTDRHVASPATAGHIKDVLRRAYSLSKSR